MHPTTRRFTLACLSLSASLVLGPAASCPAEARVRGDVHSGGPGAAVPLGGARVWLYEATGARARLVGIGVTNAAGIFAIPSEWSGATSDGVFYATAELGNRVQLVTVIGPTLAPYVAVNELTAVAAGYAMAQFTRGGAMSGSHLGLRVAAGMSDNLAPPSTGASSAALLASPSGDQTNSLRSTRALANLVALYVRNRGEGIGYFFALATPPGRVPELLRAA